MEQKIGVSENVDLVRWFPMAAREEALTAVKALKALPEGSHKWWTLQLQVGGEQVSIPYRIYHDPTQIKIGTLTSMQRELTICLLTRHGDGFVRQRSLSQVLFSRSIWIPPFVVQLAGEYVVEIL